ncbi:MAG: alpha/beta hydrolase [Phycisphaerales bacterium]
MAVSVAWLISAMILCSSSTTGHWPPELANGLQNADAAIGLSHDAAEAMIDELWNEACEQHRAALAAELEAEAVTVGDVTMRLLLRTFGEAPENGHSLWISLHGGGGTTANVNDQQWRNQIRLYQPQEGIYVAPRAPTDTWNLWHHGHIDGLLTRLIAAYVIVHDVDPDRVYLLGYSAGGDGVYQLAPRMADTFAAAAMMAGHPNDAQPASLRNLPFALYAGELDHAYNRNAVAKEWGERLDGLQQEDPDGYIHHVRIMKGKGHWMDGEDSEAIEWMAGFTRNPWPGRIVWVQDDVVHERFYWLSCPPGKAVARSTVTAEVTGQVITINSSDVENITLWLRDELIDLDQEIAIVADGREVFRGMIERSRDAIRSSLTSSLDPRMAASAVIAITLPGVEKSD